MKIQVAEIARILGAEIVGDSSVEIDKVSKIEEGETGSISFLANPLYTSFLYSSQASAVIVSREFEPTQEVTATLLKVEDPYIAFTRLLEFAESFLESHPKNGIESPSSISEEAILGEGVHIGAFSYISKGATIGDNVVIYPQVFIGENVKIGDGTVIYPQVSVQSGCKVGARCTLHTGARIGSDGFGFAPQGDGTYIKVPQTGIVILEDEVEVGANTCIDRATMGSTIIYRGAKLDNLVQIGHNVEVGSHTAIAAQTGISGSTKLGKKCLIGGQVGITGHLKIADFTKIDAQSGVNRSLAEEGKVYRGSPIQPYRQQLKSELMFRKLVEMKNRIDALEKRIGDSL